MGDEEDGASVGMATFDLVEEQGEGIDSTGVQFDRGLAGLRRVQERGVVGGVDEREMVAEAVSGRWTGMQTGAGADAAEPLSVTRVRPRAK
jgi:hypothetical protein